jgi:hypothetical protein
LSDIFAAGGGLNPVDTAWMNEKIKRFMENDLSDAFDGKLQF